jgi:hypothetical protein
MTFLLYKKNEGNKEQTAATTAVAQTPCLLVLRQRMSRRSTVSGQTTGILLPTLYRNNRNETKKQIRNNP